MAEASWDNSGLPPAKKGMATWAKVLLGCGVVFLLIIGGCVVGGAVLFKKGGSMVKDSIKPEWSELRSAVDQLHAEEGAKAFYAAHPGLKPNYADEAAFLEAWKSWSKDLEPLPVQPPDILSGRLSVNATFNNGERSKQIVYTTAASKSLVATWENGKLTDIGVH
jgi:hypothetical protein